MTVYPEEDLYHYLIEDQSRQAFDAGDISNESRLKIKQAYPCKLYTPHFFIAVALGLVTVVAVFFTSILLWLLIRAESSLSISLLCGFLTVACYFFLENMVKGKNYFNAGIDNVLMLLILIFTGAILIIGFENPSWIFFHGLMMLVSLCLCLRFADAFMAIISCAFFLIFSFLLYLKLSVDAFAYSPFVMMLIIALLYFVIKKTTTQIKFVYEKCFTALTFFLLIAFYAAGNYWVISQLQFAVLNNDSHIIFGSFFWIFTFLIPIVYVAYGVIKKGMLHLRTGLVLLASMVLTYKYYFTLVPVEIEMLVVGALLVALSYFLIKLLRQPRYGYTSENTSTQPAWTSVEALIVAETLGGSESKSSENNLMAGGSGGGGGASGEY